MSAPKLIPLRTEDDLRAALGWTPKAQRLIAAGKKARPVMTLAQFQARRKRNRLARKNRKRNAS